VQGANIDIARRAFAGLSGEGDVAAGFALLAEDVEVHDHDIPDAEVYRGGAGVIEWGTNWAESWDQWSMELQDLVEAGEDRVVALFHIKARGVGSGIEVEREDAIVYTLRDQKIARLDYYNDQPEALAAAGVER